MLTEGFTSIVQSKLTANIILCLYTVPSLPRDLTAGCFSYSNIFLKWQRPDPPNGLIKNYTVSGYKKSTYLQLLVFIHIIYMYRYLIILKIKMMMTIIIGNPPVLLM